MTLPAAGQRLLRELARYGTHLGLDHFLRLLHALGDPQIGLPVVLVAGTNGKGSTAAYLAAMASAAGYRTGLYTSPHLEEVEERIRINGRAIDGTRIAALIEEVTVAAGREKPTYFEALTAAAFLHFHRFKVELAVLEVGLGGRLDATNASEPVLSLITDISLDHQEFLGGTPGAIATEKAGVLRPGKPAIIGVVGASARSAIALRGERIGSRLLWSEGNAQWLEGGRDREGEREPAVLQTKRASYRLCPALAGEHQLRNLAVAILAAEELANLGWSGMGRREIERGAAATHWPGRLERLVGPQGERILLDVAHNPAGIEALLRYLPRDAGPYLFVFGALADKDIALMLPALASCGQAIILTLPETERGREPADLAAILASQTSCEVEIARSITAALAAALERLNKRPDGTLVVCGSTFVVGPFRRLLRERWGYPAPARDVWPALEGD